MADLQSKAVEYTEQNQARLLTILQDLIRIPSENRSPEGNESGCQQYISTLLRQAGYEPDIYEPDAVPELGQHSLATPSRSYRGRPNVAVRRSGVGGGGSSLILSGHVDTVPRGSLPWTRDPFGGVVEDGRLYGRGANDMKAGVAINLFLLEALSRLEIRLRGDITFESVVDEEFGGVNGTLASRLRGYGADAAVITEPTSLRICAGQRGGRTAHLTFCAGGGVLGPRPEAGPEAGVVDQLTCFLQELPAFAQQRRNASRPHPLYAGSSDPVPVTVTKISTGPWGTGEPITVPEACQVELYWQLMPGETQAEVDHEFLAWLQELVSRFQSVFVDAPKVSFPIRWLPGSAIAATDPLCLRLQHAASEALGNEVAICGIEGPCDMFVFHQFGIPAVLWGPGGGGTHGSDEFVVTDTVVSAAKTLMYFVCDWCRVG